MGENGNTFDWLGIYEPINYFPFSTIIFKIRNMLLNMFILILTLKSIKMRQTTINSSIPPTTNLETDFTKYLMNFVGGDNRLSHCSGIRIHNHLVPIRTHNHLAKLALWLSCIVSVYLYGLFDSMFLLCRKRVLEWII